MYIPTLPVAAAVAPATLPAPRSPVESVVRQLHDRLAGDLQLRHMLEASLARAAEVGAARLSAEAYATLPWPKDAIAYLRFLRAYGREARTRPDAGDYGDHFGRLIGQPLDDGGRALPTDPYFAEWLGRYRAAVAQDLSAA